MYLRTANHIAELCRQVKLTLEESSCYSSVITLIPTWFSLVKTYCELGWPTPMDVGVC